MIVFNNYDYVFLLYASKRKKIYVYMLMGDYIFYCMLKARKKTNNYIFVCMVPFLELKNS